MTSRRVAIVPVTLEVLRQVLCLPEGTEIEDVMIDIDQPGILRLRVTHGDLPEVRVGNCIPIVHPRFASVSEDGRPPRPQFLDWGV